MQLIPSIDLRGGNSVRLFKGNFAQETRYELSPLELLERYATLGAQWLHIVDLDGARDGQLANRAVIVALAERQRVKLQVGGGLRSAAVIDDLLQAGVARVVLGSAAVEQTDAALGWLRRHGGEKVCAAFDIKLDASGVPRLYTRGWTQGTAVSLWDITARFHDAGLRHLLCTDIDRDGALAGPAIDLYREGLRRFPDIQWQASGGVRSAADLHALAAAGCAAAISGKALLEQRIPESELTPFLPRAVAGAGNTRPGAPAAR